MRKTIKRRKFLVSGLQAGLALPLLAAGLTSCVSSGEKQEKTDSIPAKKLNILILGGTSFLGPHQIAYALSRGHSVTMFNRGKTEPGIYKDLFDKVTPLYGDRNGDLASLESGKWDAVIDNSGNRDGWAKMTASLLKDKADLYMYTSSTGVFYPYLTEGDTEEHPVLMEVPAGVTDEIELLEYRYGVMKANSEAEVRAEFGEDRSIIIRPTYMIGPADKTNRFIHWPLRLSKGGDVLVPGSPADPVQYADVRNVAEWMIRLIESGQTGTFNAAGPEQKMGMADFVMEAQKAFDVKSNYIQVDDQAFLKEQNIWDMVPWIMPEGNNLHSARISNAKAVGSGLTFRSISMTTKDTYDWWNSDALTDEDRKKYEENPSIVLNREKEILKAWAEKING